MGILKVFLLGEHDYDHHRILGIYASEEKALELMSQYQENNRVGAND